MPRKEKVCPKCGQKGKSTDVFCEICGTKLVVEKEEEKEDEDYNSQEKVWQIRYTFSILDNKVEISL